MLERGAFPNDFFKIVFGPDLIFKVGLFLRELISQCGDFLKCQGVLDSDGHLPRGTQQEIDDLWAECVLIAASERQNAERPASADQRQSVDRLQALRTSLRSLLFRDV